QPPHGRDVFVRVNLDGRAAEARSVDNAGVVELVADDDVLAAQNGRDGARVGGEARLIHQRRLGALEGRQPPLQLGVQAHGAGDGPHGSGAGAVCIDGPAGRLPQLRVVGQAQVVVGREVDDLFAVKEDRKSTRLNSSHVKI